MSFIHAAFLAAGLAVAIPWLLHLTRRRKYQRIRLGSLQFLEPLVRDRQRMQRVEQWPLLLLRCLAILLLALLFARPFIPRPATAPPAEGEELVLLDASGSITDAQAEAIRKQAARTLSKLPPTHRPVLAAVADRVEILGSLDEYRPIPGAPGNAAAAVDWIVDRAASAPDSIAGMHWFTDLQSASLPASPSRLWPSGVTAAIHPVLPPDTHNVSIDSVDLLTPFGGGEWEIEARVRVHGVPGRKPIGLLLTAADGSRHEARVPAAGGPVRISWSSDVPKHSPLLGELALLRGDDAWPADDRRAFAFATTSPARVALVDGDPGTSRFLSETYFLEKALHASSAGKALSPFRATVTRSIPSRDETPDVIALCNVSSLSAFEAQLLRHHLDQGAGVALFLGDLVRPSLWKDSGLVPTGLRERADPQPDFIRHGQLGHPALAGIGSEALHGLGLLALAHRFTWDDDADWQTLLAFDRNAPLMAVHRAQKLALFAHPVNREGSDLPLDAAFVPLVQGLFKYLAAPDSSTESGAPERIQIETATPGVDESRAPGRHLEGALMTVVNADPAESDVRQAPEATFREVLGLPASDAPPAELPEPAVEDDSTHQREGELWPWLLAGLLLLLIVENALAARSARRTADAHAP